jgi:hypothetical protein
MMRAFMALFWGLVIFWVVGADADAQTAPSPAPWPHEVQGNSPDGVQKARDIALQNARQAVLDYLRGQRPPLQSWEPSVDDIRADLIESERSLPTVTEGGYVFHRVTLTLKPPDLKRFRALDKEAHQRLERHEREIRRAERTLLAAKTLVGILLLLAVTLIYIRIDDWTRRAYTRWLQAAAVVLLAGTSIGLWMLP